MDRDSLAGLIADILSKQTGSPTKEKVRRHHLHHSRSRFEIYRLIRQQNSLLQFESFSLHTKTSYYLGREIVNTFLS